jgi:hypothetical protein
MFRPHTAIISYRILSKGPYSVGSLRKTNPKSLDNPRSSMLLRLTVSQYVLVSSTLVAMLLSEICGRVSVGRPLWREDGSAICNVITQWSVSRRTGNRTLLSHLRLPQPGGPGSPIYILQEHHITAAIQTPDTRMTPWDVTGKYEVKIVVKRTQGGTITQLEGIIS